MDVQIALNCFLSVFINISSTQGWEFDRWIIQSLKNIDGNDSIFLTIELIFRSFDHIKLLIRSKTDDQIPNPGTT